jgi:hypothetical protein
VCKVAKSICSGGDWSGWDQHIFFLRQQLPLLKKNEIGSSDVNSRDLYFVGEKLARGTSDMPTGTSNSERAVVVGSLILAKSKRVPLLYNLTISPFIHI